MSYTNDIKETVDTLDLNNYIKVLKRNAYGFHNFYNFKLRISLCFGTIFFKKTKNLEESSSRNHTNRFHSLNFLHQYQLIKSRKSLFSICLL